MSSAKTSSIEQACNAIMINCSNSQIVEKSDQEAAHMQIRGSLKTTEFDQFSVNKMCNNGRWTDQEHLIFLACVIEFGRDWKKIEFYVQTRSSSQARSHAQKVLKKMDRNAIYKEINLLKSKLDFKAKDHCCEGLTFLNDNQADIERLMESKRPFKRQKVDENDVLEVASSRNSCLNEVIVKSPDNNCIKLAQLCNTVEKNQKSNVLTPKTCASSPSTPNANDFLLDKIVVSEQLKNEPKSSCNSAEKQKSCFRNLKENMIEAVKINQPSFQKNEENLQFKKLNHNIQANLSSDDMHDGDELFDFDLYSIFKSSSLSNSIEDFQPLNSFVNASLKEADKLNTFKDFSFMGDTQFPLWMQY